MCGQPCDMQAIHALSLQYGFNIIEDASHAIGARYQGEPVGNGRYSDVTVFSFHPVKIITTGEGGMVVTSTITYAVNGKQYVMVFTGEGQSLTTNVLALTKDVMPAPVRNSSGIFVFALP